MSDSPPTVFTWQWPAVAIYSVAFLTIGTLVGLGKVHSEALLALLAVFAPSPYNAARTAIANTSTVSVTDTHVERTTVVPAPAPVSTPLPVSVPVSVDEESNE